MADTTRAVRDLAETLRRAVDAREIMHPFTVMEFRAHGWLKRERGGNPFSNVPRAHRLTQKGVRALDHARRAARSTPTGEQPNG